MKLTVKKEQLPETPESFLHHAGWGLIHDRKRGVSSFVKRLGSGFYPRLHLYVDERDDLIIFYMHLDQKETSYAGSHMHNAEYDNELVAAEFENIKGLLGIRSGSNQNNNNQVRNNPIKTEVEIKISHPQYNSGNFAADLADLKAAKPKSFWQRLLGL
jgi:hypothetical protein